MILSVYRASGISAVSPHSGSWGPVCVSTGTFTIALVPSTAGFAAPGLLHGRRVTCQSSCSLASAHQCVRSLLASSESAFLSDTSLVPYSRSSWVKTTVLVRCWTRSCGISVVCGSSTTGHVYHSMRTLTLASLHNWDIDDHVNALDQWDVHGLLHSSLRNRLLRITWITSATCSNMICGTGGVHDLWHRTAPMGLPRSSGPSVSLAPVVVPELSGWLAPGTHRDTGNKWQQQISKDSTCWRCAR